MRPEFIGKQESEQRELNAGGISDGRGSTDNKPNKAQIKAINLVAVKSAAERSASIVGYVRNGDVVTILGTEKGYKKIQFQDLIGYVRHRFFKEV